MLKKILIGIAGLILALAAFIIYTLSPTPSFMRNKEVDGVRIEAKISNDDRSPIIRTYTKEEFDNFNQEKIEKINDKISGRIEGDLPSIHLLENAKINLTFYKDGEKVEPEDAYIKITAHASDYRDPTKKTLYRWRTNRRRRKNLLLRYKKILCPIRKILHRIPKI